MEFERKRKKILFVLSGKVNELSKAKISTIVNAIIKISITVNAIIKI